jgi:hypothetical protein
VAINELLNCHGPPSGGAMFSNAERVMSCKTASTSASVGAFGLAAEVAGPVCP